MTTSVAEYGRTDGVPSTANPPRKWRLWTGRIVSAIPVLMMLMSAGMKLSGSTEVTGMFTGKFGYQQSSLLSIAILEIACVVIYAIPRTAVLGAILMTGYLGGAVATHVRVGDAFIAPVVLAIFAWAGLYLRDERLHSLLPFRR
jgi:hypothetical protein